MSDIQPETLSTNTENLFNKSESMTQIKGLQNHSIAESAFQDAYEFGPYNPPISRKLMEGICNISAPTLVKLEKAGVITPKKIKYGGLETVTYRPEDIRAVLKSKGVSYKKKKDAEVISIFSAKGGNGKTSFTANLAAQLSLLGPTLVIDADSQGDLTSLMIPPKRADQLLDKNDLEPTILDLFDWDLKDGSEPIYETLPFERVIKKISPTLDLIPSDLDISEVNYLLAFNKDKINASDKNRKNKILYMVKDVISKLSSRYDYIVCDLAPNIEIFNIKKSFSSRTTSHNCSNSNVTASNSRNVTKSYYIQCLASFGKIKFNRKKVTSKKMTNFAVFGGKYVTT